MRQEETKVIPFQGVSFDLTKSLTTPIEVLTVDLKADHSWDLTVRGTQSEFLKLAEEGCIDAALAGPPRSTSSRARQPSLPRPAPAERQGHSFWGAPES